MLSKEIIAEVPGSAQHRNAIRAKQEKGYRRHDQQVANKANTDSIASGGKNTRLQQYKIDKAAKARDAKSKVGGDISDFAKQRISVGNIQQDDNGLFYQYTKNGWVEVTGVSMGKDGKPQGKSQLAPGAKPLAKGDGLSQQLSAKATGNGPVEKPTIGDRINKAIGGKLANKTMNDPDASTAAKVGAVAGAGLGRLASKMIKKPQAQAPKPDLPKGVHMNDLHLHQKGMVDQGKDQGARIEHAKQFLELLKKHDVKYNVDKYVQAITPAIKRSGLQKAAPEFYGQFVQQVRAMRAEAFEYANSVLEAAGITWEQAGYKVSLHEDASDVVFLTPIVAMNELNEAIEIQELKNLAGM